MVVNYFTTFDANNINIWSGLGIYYRRILEKGSYEINHLNYITFPNHYVHSINSRIHGLIRKKYSPRFNLAVSKFYAREAAKNINPGALIFTPNIEALAFMNNGYKKVLYSDATFERLVNFYPSYSKFTEKSIKLGHQIERRALENADLIIYTSEWAADSAVNFYNADPKKIHIIPFAANLQHTPSKSEIESNVVERNLHQKVELIFFGTDWERKGGDIALEVVQRLNNNGIKSVLHVVGIKKYPNGINKTYIKDHGFFSKEDPKNQQLIVTLLLKSHFLILPTKADCTPIVLSEANSCALPCIASDVGGNSNIIKNNINGRIFPLKNFIEDAINYITIMKQSPDLYRNLCYSSYNQYSKELNIDIAAAKLSKLISSL